MKDHRCSLKNYENQYFLLCEADMLPRLELQCSTEEYDDSGDGVAGQKITVSRD